MKQARLQATGHKIYINRKEIGSEQPSVVIEDKVIEGVMGIKKELFVELMTYLA